MVGVSVRATWGFYGANLWVQPNFILQQIMMAPAAMDFLTPNYAVAQYLGAFYLSQALPTTAYCLLTAYPPYPELLRTAYLLRTYSVLLITHCLPRCLLSDGADGLCPHQGLEQVRPARCHRHQLAPVPHLC